MNWTNGAESVAKAWTEAQSNMWKNWYDWVQAAPAMNVFDAGVMAQWQKLATQGLEIWLANAEPTTKGVAHRLVASQEAMMRFIKFASDSWQSIAAKVEAGDGWEAAMSETMDQVRQEFIQTPQKLFEATQDSAELWRLYLEEVQKLIQPWAASFQKASGHFGQPTDGNGSALLEMTKLYWDAHERTFGRIAESPTLGYTRELDEKILKGFDAWQEFREASFEYQIMLAEAWVRVFEKLMEELMALAQKGEAITSLRELVDLWNTVADSVYLDLFRTEEYIRGQGRLVNAGMAYRLQQREVTEIFTQMIDLPSRTEVDEAHQMIYQQGREIKALKKALAESAVQTGQVATQADLDKAGQTVETLQKELKALQKTVAELQAAAKATDPAKPKRSTKSSQSSTRRKRTSAKGSNATAGKTEEGG